MRTLLICHEGALLDQDGLARWLGSFSEVVGKVVLRETTGRKWRRVIKEIKRSGLAKFIDVAAFRIYYRLFVAPQDREWETRKLKELESVYPEPTNVPVLITQGPNSDASLEFIADTRPDIIVARCKVILNKRIFSLASTGTFVMHPGVCPEYRNAHGCFWALTRGDFERVGMTLLKIDEGVDTGPIYGYYSYDYDSVHESHIRIQTRVLLENLETLREKLTEIYEGRAQSIGVTGRESRTWGHPRMTKHLAWKIRARRTGR
jgi:methionyl-tRNA formyltransferase